MRNQTVRIPPTVRPHDFAEALWTQGLRLATVARDGSWLVVPHGEPLQHDGKLRFVHPAAVPGAAR